MVFLELYSRKWNISEYVHFTGIARTPWIIEVHRGMPDNLVHPYNKEQIHGTKVIWDIITNINALH